MYTHDQLCVYIYIIYTPNLELGIAVSVREREQGHFRGSSEGARARSRGARGSTGGALGRSKQARRAQQREEIFRLLGEPDLAAPYPATAALVIYHSVSLLLPRFLQLRPLLASSCANEMLLDEGQSICQMCGIELGSNEKLRWKKNALENENSILHQRLFQAGHVIQSNKVSLRDLQVEKKEVEKMCVGIVIDGDRVQKAAVFAPSLHPLPKKARVKVETGLALAKGFCN